MPDIEKINNVAVADISKLDALTFAHGQKVNNQDLSLVTDAHTLIATVTVPADESAPVCEIDFIDGAGGVVFDNTYDIYEWVFTSIHAETDNSAFGFQFNNSGVTGDVGGFNETITSTHFKAEHSEGAASGFGYTESGDQAEGVALQRLTYSQQIDTDEAASGILRLYDPSQTSYVKHFQATGNYVHHSSHYSQNFFVGGYVNTTTAIDEIRFMMESGDINAGEIKMYGIKKS